MNKFFAAAAVVGFAGLANASVVNGSFETGDFSGWTTVDASSGSLYGVDPTIGHTGPNAAFFGATEFTADAIHQDVPTVPGQQYTFSFWLENWASGDDSFRALWNGVEVFNNTAGEFDYTEFSFNVVGGPGATSNIRFESYDDPSYFILDDVSVTVVPAPGAAALLGLGGLLMARRRR